MYCPQCGEPQRVGAQRCTNCGLAFTRQEAVGQRPERRVTQNPGNGTRRRTSRRRSGGGAALLAWMAFIVLLVIGGIALASVIKSEVVQPYVADRVDQTIAQELGSAIPIPTLPPEALSGNESLVITQEELNRRIQENAGQLGPLQDIRAEITADEIVVHLGAYGVSGSYHARVAAENGRVIVTEGRLDGALGWFVSGDRLTSIINREVERSLNSASVSVDSVALEPGQMIVAVSPA